MTSSGYGKLQGYQSSATVESKQNLMMWWQCLKEQRNGQKFISVTTLVSEEWLDKIYNIQVQDF